MQLVKKMKRCEIITNFDFDKFEKIKNNYSFKNFLILTDDDNIQAGMIQRGFKSKDIRYYVGYNNTAAERSNKNAINLTREFQKKILGNMYDGIEIGEIMKLTIIRDIRLIDWCYNAILDNDNVVFLFKRSLWWHYCILDIAVHLGRESKFGVSKIFNSEITSIEFSNNWKKRYPIIYEIVEKSSMEYYRNQNSESFSSLVSQISLTRCEGAKFGFFLVNDANDFYVKTIWRVLEKLKEQNEKITLFTFLGQTDDQIKEKGYTPFNIEYMIYEIYPKIQMIKKEKILRYYSRLKRWKNNFLLKIMREKNKTYSKCLRYLQKHRHLQDFGKLIYPLGGIIVVPYKRMFTENGFFTLAYKNILFYLENKIENSEDVLVGTLAKEDASIMYNFFNTINTISSENIILKSYIKYFFNDIKISDMTRIMLKIELINHIFKKIKFKSIIVSADGTQNNHIVCRVAKNHDIPSFQFAPSHTAFTEIHAFFFTASKIFVGGIRSKEKIADCGVNKDRLIITGDPKYDYIPKFMEIRRKYMENRSKNHRKLIVVATSRWNDNDEVWMSELIKYCNKKNYDIIIRPHPVYSVAPARMEEGSRKLLEIERRCNGLRYQFSTKGEIREILTRADLVITDFSASGLESTLADIPLVLANIGKKSLEWGSSYVEENVVLHAETMQDLYKNIEDIFHNNFMQTNLAIARKKFMLKFNYLNDGNAAQRITKLLTSRTETKPRLL